MMRGGRQGPDRRVQACECKRASGSNFRENETLELEAGVSALREHETRISFAYKRQKESPTAPAKRVQCFQQSDERIERASCLFGRNQIARPSRTVPKVIAHAGQSSAGEHFGVCDKITT
jgi:hypothetical protein